MDKTAFKKWWLTLVKALNWSKLIRLASPFTYFYDQAYQMQFILYHLFFVPQVCSRAIRYFNPVNQQFSKILLQIFKSVFNIAKGLKMTNPAVTCLFYYTPSEAPVSSSLVVILKIFIDAFICSHGSSVLWYDVGNMSISGIPEFCCDVCHFRKHSFSYRSNYQSLILRNKQRGYFAYISLILQSILISSTFVLLICVCWISDYNQQQKTKG